LPLNKLFVGGFDLTNKEEMNVRNHKRKKERNNE
jgi:hypothetical protein